MVHIPRWQILMILAVLLVGIIFAAPNLMGRDSAEALPGWIPSNQINLGLDLQGGSYLLLEADIEGVIQEQMENLVDSVRVGLRRADIGYSSLGVESRQVVFTLRDPSLAADVREVLREVAPTILISIDDESGKAHLSLSEAELTQRRNNVIEQAIEVVRRRIDETGVREPSIQRQGEDRILLQMPGLSDPERVKDLLKQTARLTFQFLDESVQRPGIDPTPAGTVILESDEPGPDGEYFSYAVRKRKIVTGETLVDAQPSFQDNQPVVSFRFDTIGAKRFGEATRTNVGRLFAIVLDGKVISAPRIREPILGGSGIISGVFTVQETQDLSLLLRAGALPADLVFLEERTVGPGLGADSIRAGKIASVLGLIFVVAFMVVTYGLFGAMANVALITNLVLLVAVLSGLQATLTLPGIAGIVLTIGMAVDANVLIFERIREETRNGRGPVTAIDAGYRRAMTTIMDSNLTTLFAAILLFIFGAGPIKGFAVTLAIGLMTSMFTAIMLTRLLIVWWLRRRRPQALPI